MRALVIFIGLVAIAFVARMMWKRYFVDPLEKKSDEGDPDAQYCLALEWFEGKGRTKSRLKAGSLFEKAATQGHRDAQAMLGMLYEKGAGGLPKDRAKSVHWYKKAAEQGHGPSQCMLGRAHYHGKGIPQDFVQAYCWLNVARARNAAAPEDIEILTVIESKLEQSHLLKVQRMSVELYEKIHG